MKKIIFAFLALSMPLFVNAQVAGLFGKKKMKTQQEMTAYQVGTVPEVDGKVVFKSDISAPGKSKADIYAALCSWASLRYTPEQSRGEWTDADYFKNLEYAQVKNADKNSGSILIQGAEELVFTNKTLAKDYTNAYYTLELTASEGSVAFVMKNISYLYVGGSENPQRINAEDWITDKEAFNKKGELSRQSGKFRVKTIDLKYELIKEITEEVNK